MESIALYFSFGVLYWHGIVVALAVAATVFLFCVLRVMQNGKLTPALWISAAAIPVGALLARLVYWVHRQEQYEGVKDAFLKMADGGYCLYGAAAGVVIVIAVFCIFTKEKCLAETFDAAAPAAALGICIGRLAAFFSTSDRGKIVENHKLQRLPFAIWEPTKEHWGVAVFIFEAAAALVICVITLVIFALTYSKLGKKRRCGDTALIFILLYCSAQCVLESLRDDSLYFIVLGFVRISQVYSAVLVFGVLLIMSIRLIKKYGFKPVMPFIWVACLALLGIAFYMELRMTSEVYVRNYVIMTVCMTLVAAAGFTMYVLTAEKPEKINEEKESE